MVAGMLLVGEREEPFLSGCLESLAPAIDLLVVNDNSSSRGRNRDTIERSTLARSGRVHIVPSSFVGFGACRSLCLAALETLVDPRWWVLKVDADEVHTEGLPVLTRDLLPRVAPRVAIVDAFFFQMCASPHYYLSVDRRHDLLFRFHAGLRFEGAVHERLLRAGRRRLAVPYRFFHYGYTASADYVQRRWRQYGALGDAVSGRQAERVEEVVAGDATRARRFAGQHPAAAAAAIAAHLSRHDAEVSRFESIARAAGGESRARTNPTPGALRLAMARWRIRALGSAQVRQAARDLACWERRHEAPA